MTFELTHCDETGACGSPTSSSVTINPPQLGPLQPAPTLLPAGSASLILSLTTTSPAECRWSPLPNTPFHAMANVFQEGQGTISHATRVSGLREGERYQFFVRSRDLPPSQRDPDDFERTTQVRVLSQANPPFPRTGNIWGWWELAKQGWENVARRDLLLGADGLSPAEILELRRRNPHILILPAVSAVERAGLPEDYFLQDVAGNKIEIWPGSFILNLTKPAVVESQALYAYQKVLETEMMVDGVFFDNVWTTISWLRDIYSRKPRIDANQDGVEDDPAALDAAWKAGMLHELSVFRNLLLHALVAAHAVNVEEVGERLNGISLGFWTADVIEGQRSFQELLTHYSRLLTEANAPQITVIESSPLDQFAYGYDYEPLNGKIPPSTLEFVGTFCPWMRFELAFTLIGDGYFAHEFGDTWHGND